MVARSRHKNLCRFLAKTPTFEFICVCRKNLLSEAAVVTNFLCQLLKGLRTNIVSNGDEQSEGPVEKEEKGPFAQE
jgi:hypothetical protein